MGQRRAGLARWTAAMAAFVATWCAVAPASADSLEIAVKATYLYKLAPFVSWPASAWASPTAPLTICVQGADPFGPILDRATAGQVVGFHPLTVRRVARLDANSGCQIAFVAGGPGQSQAQALQAVQDAPILTVTEDSRESGGRGIVNLQLEGGRVRFSIDPAQAEHSGIVISSKLLALAVAVRR